MIVRRAQDANDTLIVIDATNNDAAWYGLTAEVSEHIRQNWNRQTAVVSRYQSALDHARRRSP